MNRFIYSIAFTFLLLGPATSKADIILTGILDGTLSGGDPKVIEIYVDGTEDLSGFSLERSANANPFGSSFNLSGTFTDEFVYLVNSSDVDDFEAVFGTTGDFANVITNSIISGNGNDAFRIVQDSDSAVIDQFGAESDDTNIYLDSWAYRNDETGPDAGFVSGNWTFGGNNALDGLDAAGIAAAVPFGTFSVGAAAVPEPNSLALIGVVAGVFAVCRRRKRNVIAEESADKALE